MGWCSYRRLAVVLLLALLVGAGRAATADVPPGTVDSLDFLARSRSGDARILRPLNYEIFSLTADTIDLRFAIRTAGNYRIRLLVARSNTAGFSPGLVLAEQTATFAKGTRAVKIPLTPEIRQFRGGWLILLIRKIDEPLKFDWVNAGLGLLVVTAGQSNTTNYECKWCGGQALDPPSSFVRALRDNEQAISKIVADRSAAIQRGKMEFVQLGSQSPIADGTYRNVWLPLGRRLYETFKVPVAFINIGWGATSIEQWNTILLPRFSYAARFKPTLVLWAQGEGDVDVNVVTDSQGQELALQHEGELRKLLQTVMGRTPAPWVLALSTVCAGRPQLPRDAIRTATTSVVNAGGLPFGVYLGPDTDAIPHSCHFETVTDFQAQSASWLANLLANPVLQPLIPVPPAS